MNNRIFKKRMISAILLLLIIRCITINSVINALETSTPLLDEYTDSLLTVYVDDDNAVGPWNGTEKHPFQYIQKGINAVRENGTVYVSNGKYNETITISKSILFIGENKGKTIIAGEKWGVVVTINADAVNMSGFTIRDGEIGVIITNSSKCLITNNTFRNNSLYGISILNSSHNNSIYCNNFLNNTGNAHDQGINFWDNGYPAGGNYWDDYTRKDTNHDGVGDTRYNISGGKNADGFPLMSPLTIFPIAHFSFTPSYPSTQDFCQFSDYSFDSDGAIVSWHWDFGDDTISTQQHPKHQYHNNGQYPVVLTVTDDLGANNTITQQILVTNVPPNASFVYSPMNPTDLQSIFFNDSSSDSDGVVVSWLWDFGDNNTSSLRNVTHQYRDNGTYQITLNVTDDDRAYHYIMKQINVSNVAPTVEFSFTPLSPTTKDIIQFTDISVDGDGTIVSWFWDFGDGTTSTLHSPSHNYSKADEYTVLLTIVDNDGASTVKQLSIPVHKTGSASFGNQFNFIFIVYIVLFVIMLGVVLFLVKKYR